MSSTLFFCLQERKEKVGERIVALQQLVSPFGKVYRTFMVLIVRKP